MMRISVAVLVLFIVGVYSDYTCPRVYDGLTNGKFDLSSQFSQGEMSANWVGLTSKDVLGYEWAIVSEDKINNKVLEGDACRLNQGFAGVPDVRRWSDVRKETSATASALNLEAGRTYYVVLRTTLSNGVYVFSMSNGIFILPQELKLEGSHKESTPSGDKKLDMTAEKRDISMGTALECPIDEANRCTRAEIPVRDILSELYGPPRFLAAPIFAVSDPDDDDDDDDDGGTLLYVPIVIAALIAALLLLLCCLLLALLLAAFGSKDGGSQKFTENVTTSTTDHVDADFGTTTEHAIADDTRVEFPDYDPSTRLSVA